MPMNAGDVVLTPGGMFHGHGHEGDQPSYWLDCLDLPLTHLLEGVYIQAHPHGAEQVTHSVEVSAMRFSRDWIARGLDAAVAHPEGLHGPRITLPTDSMPSDRKSTRLQSLMRTSYAVICLKKNIYTIT